MFKYFVVCIVLIVFFDSTNASTIKVCPSCSTRSLKQAIAISNSGDTIIVSHGIYNESNLLIDKSLTLIGKDYPVIDAQFRSGIFTIMKARRTFIKGFQLQNVKVSYVNDLAAISIVNSNGCVIENNKLNKAYYGVHVSKSDSCYIGHNVLVANAKKESAAGNGIHLWYCKNALIEGNTIRGHRDGIYLEFVENSLIKNNTSTRQIRYGLHFMFSHNNEFFKNTFQDNGAGVAVMYSKKIKMYENKFFDNWSSISTGLLLKEISDGFIERNSFKKNTTAIYMEGCNRNNIMNNNFIENGWALKILGNCEDNRILKNNFISNTFEVVTNSSRNVNIFENNYWSKYNGYDLNKDGVGDVPHSPITLFSYMLEQIPPSIVLLRSLFIDLLNLAEKITPVITPVDFKDASPKMKLNTWSK